jgi:hypothetical protein
VKVAWLVEARTARYECWCLGIRFEIKLRI